MDDRPSGLGAWQHLADVVLQAAALAARVDRNHSPDPLAGLRIDDEEVERLVTELPGLESSGRAGEEVVDSFSDDLEAARDAFLEELAGGKGPVAMLAASAGLSVLEAAVLAVLVAVELDPRRQRLVGYLNDDVTVRRLTPWSLARLPGFGPSAVEALAPGAGLRRAALIGPSGGDQPWGATPAAVSPPVLWWFVGASEHDPDLPAAARAVAATAPGTPATARLVLAVAPDRRRRLAAALAGLGTAGGLVTPPPEGTAAWDAVVRAATLRGLGVVLELDGVPDPATRERIERCEHLRFALVAASQPPLPSMPEVPWSEVEVPPAAATPAEWADRFPGTDLPPYPLTADQLDLVARASEALGGDLRAGMRRLAAGHIDTTATRITPSRTWEDLVLAPHLEAQVRSVAVRARQRDVVFGRWGFSRQPSTGVAALFAGPSGTGKTLAAEVIADDLGVDLYKVDLANLVSKYIGETEKNLSAVFDAAEATNVVLFFDEADALLGKRSDVSDAHDRYANIEVAYLLQRLERFEGVTVMATNLAKNIDDAFLRRLHVVVEFPMPGPAERRRIWRRSFPPAAPLATGLDLDPFADRLELSGGTIRNAALGAAFLAAEAGTPITGTHLVASVRAELAKVGRLDPAGELAGLG